MTRIQIDEKTAIGDKASEIMYRHRRLLGGATLISTALSAFMFDFAWAYFEPYSLRFYLDGHSVPADMNPEEAAMYIDFFIFILVMTTSTVLPAATFLYLRYRRRNGRV